MIYKFIIQKFISIYIIHKCIYMYVCVYIYIYIFL